MRWDEINLEMKLWTIPKTKNGDSHTIPIVPQALEILENRYVNRTSEWVFPSNSSSGHLQDPKKAWQRLLVRAEISDLRIHDLRDPLVAGKRPLVPA